MTITFTYREDGAWGTGKGAALTNAEIDGNMWAAQQALNTLLAVGLVPEAIGSVTQDGDVLTILGTNATNFGSFTMPVRRLNPTGAWITATAYAVDDVVYQGGASYAALEAHTSGTFATDLSNDLWIAITNPAPALADLSDASIATPATGHMLRWNGTDWANVVSPDLASGGVYKVNTVQVVGAQQSAVADATEDLASVKTQLNLALAALRAHGLIASS